MKRPTALFIALPVFAWAIYRAITIAITTEEAITYNHYVLQGMAAIFTAPYQPANPVLQTLLTYISIRTFRTTEWWFRAPALVGLLVYLGAAYRACTVFCKPGYMIMICFAAFAVNPFTIGWLPISNGAWMGGGFFLLGLVQLVPLLWEQHPQLSRLAQASLFLGVACGFDISYVFPSLAVIFLFLHIEFWGQRRLNFWTAVNQLVLPWFLLTFVIWSLPFVALAEPVRVEILCVALVPGLAVLSLPWIVERPTTWKLIGPVVLTILFCAEFGRIPDLFHRGPESALPQLARALRDQIRRSPARSVTVGTTGALWESVEFYRHRYALGAVQPIDLKLPLSSADYLILPRGTSPEPGQHKVLESGSLVLFAREPR